MKMVMVEFKGRRSGYFRLKPVFKVGRKDCSRCGKMGHVGNTTQKVRLRSEA